MVYPLTKKKMVEEEYVSMCRWDTVNVYGGDHDKALFAVDHPIPKKEGGRVGLGRGLLYVCQRGKKTFHFSCYLFAYVIIYFVCVLLRSFTQK